MNYCPGCGAGLVRGVPPEDTRERHLCQACGLVHYLNPKVIVGSVATDAQGRILLCRRAIEPRAGYWTLPAGFLELGETTREGALREAREEAQAELELRGVLALYDLDTIGQVQVFYAARLLGEVAPGPESLEVELFRWEEIPWDALAFPSVRWALRYHKQVEGQAVYPPDTRSKSGRR